MIYFLIYILFYLIFLLQITINLRKRSEIQYYFKYNQFSFIPFDYIYVLLYSLFYPLIYIFLFFNFIFYLNYKKNLTDVNWFTFDLFDLDNLDVFSGKFGTGKTR